MERGVSAAVFMPPSIAPAAIRRVELEDRLVVAPGRLTLVTGPAGYGKTTLVRQWLTTVSSPWRWITLDPAIAHPETFWPIVVRALRGLVPGAVLDALDAASADRVDPPTLVRELVDDLLRMPDASPITLVVDDAHLLGPDVWHDIEWLVGHQPGTLHLTLISRTDPTFSIARLRATGNLTEIRHRDLSLTLAETEAVLDRWDGCARQVSHGDLARTIFERTEGWAAGVQLLLLALDRGATPDDIARHPGRQGVVSEMLLAEALDRQPPDIRQFLRQTAVATVLTPGLCTALTGRDDAQSVLRQLAREHVFLSPVEGAGDHYRYHPLLTEVLLLELGMDRPEAAAELRRRASRWYEQIGDHAAAIDQALAGHDHDLALDLIVRHLADLGAAGQRQALGRWLLAIPDSEIDVDPDRAVRYCQSLLYIVRPEWLRALSRAQLAVGDDRPDLQARVELFSAFIHGGQGHIDRFAATIDAARARRPAGVEEPADEIVDAWHARLLVLHGQADAAVPIALDVFRRPRRLLPDLTARGVLAVTMLAAGDPSGHDLVADAVAAWRSVGEPDLGGMADVLAAASGVHLERGDLDEAENLAAAAVAVSAERPTHLLGVQAEVALARVDLASGRDADARRRLAALRSRMVRNGAAPAVLDLIDAVPRSAQPSPLPNGTEALTERELEVLRHLASHLTYPEIGRELYISRHTVKTYAGRVYRKLAVDGRSGAVRAARERGLI